MRLKHDPVARKAYEEASDAIRRHLHEGGCGCAACGPWGCNGYVKMCEKLERLNRRLQKLRVLNRAK